MGEWSDFFEDFPEENPANWINGVYAGPKGAQLQSEHQARFDAARAKVSAEQDRLDSTNAIYRVCNDMAIPQSERYDLSVRYRTSSGEKHA